MRWPLLFQPVRDGGLTCCLRLPGLCSSSHPQVFQREMEELGKSLFSITPMIRRFGELVGTLGRVAWGRVPMPGKGRCGQLMRPRHWPSFHPPCPAPPSPAADFDLTGKRLVLEQIEGMAERFQLVMKRLELADDPVGNMLLRQQRVQM